MGKAARISYNQETATRKLKSECNATFPIIASQGRSGKCKINKERKWGFSRKQKIPQGNYHTSQINMLKFFLEVKHTKSKQRILCTMHLGLY